MTASLRDELVVLTTDLIRFPSTADQPDQLIAAIGYAEAYLGSIPGLHVHRSEAVGKPAIVAALRPTHTPALMLNGHIDVVPARPDQFEPQVRNGRIYGRASQDMKSGVAVALRLFKALAALDPRPDVGLQIVSDEEIGGANGTGRLLKEGWRCGIFIALEPTDLRVCFTHKGGLWVEVTLPGAPAHGSRPWLGRNPILALNAGLEALSRRFPHPTEEAWITTATPTGVAAGGSASNQIPAQARLNLDIRHIPEDKPDAILSSIQECFPTAEVVFTERVAPMINDPATPIIRALADVAARVRGQPTEFFCEHFASDARYYSNSGMPAICFGPVGAGLHSDEEWVDIDSLVQLYTVLFEFTTHNA
ncbi:MAG: M20/M25/M40 family metallo-hydrolase [Chloroflexales bacterium]|nr:M20/M25/M40 family metallo-hydrolase [Chloroflexales bacterium]